MNREIVIAKYINAVEKILVAFHLNIEPENEDIAIVTLKTKEFTNALRELYLSNDENKDDKFITCKNNHIVHLTCQQSINRNRCLICSFKYLI